MRKPTSIILLLLAVFVLWQCTRPQNEYSSFHTFPHGEWLYEDTLVFTPEFSHPDEDFSECPDTTSETAVKCNIDIVVCHTNGYPYSNLWIEIARQLTDSTTSADTINIQLADIYGNWLGKGSGMSITHTSTAIHDVDVESGTTIKVRHIMRTDTLPEIDRIGLIFHPSQP